MLGKDTIEVILMPEDTVNISFEFNTGRYYITLKTKSEEFKIETPNLRIRESLIDKLKQFRGGIFEGISNLIVSLDNGEWYLSPVSSISRETIKNHIQTISDDVNKPDHYTKGGIETIDFLKAKLSGEEFKGFLKGNVLKYISRSAFKEQEEKDLKKAQFYLNKLVSFYVQR